MTKSRLVCGTPIWMFHPCSPPPVRPRYSKHFPLTEYLDQLKDKGRYTQTGTPLSTSSRLRGIESNLFLLILHPPELQGSKPFAPMYTFKDLIGFGLGICLFRLKVKILWQLVKTRFLFIFPVAFVFCQTVLVGCVCVGVCVLVCVCMKEQGEKAESRSFTDNPDKYLLISHQGNQNTGNIKAFHSHSERVGHSTHLICLIAQPCNDSVRLFFLRMLRNRSDGAYRESSIKLFVYLILFKWELGSSKMSPHLSFQFFWQPFFMITFSLFICNDSCKCFNDSKGSCELCRRITSF